MSTPRTAPPVTYPPQLPISQRKDEILAAIRDHQVVIVAGETGSGKTTQLPKICLELGRGTERLIGHTQPRRLAARTVADRIAEELKTPLGSTIGYQVRFTDRVSAATMVKVMTDGILLNEIQKDRQLRRYDTLIIDEAHERSLNIDFILGHLKQLLPRRPDLKLIITSATIDPERFASHFGGLPAASGKRAATAPIIEVSGRTYPVEMRYRPIADDGEDRDQVQAILDAVAELRREPPGDILVFASGEREIRDAADALRKQKLPDTEVLPLYARLSTAEQHRVFAPHAGRRIVIATNVAETSLTVPGIKYVIDPGTARISRYSARTKVQRLPIEPVSQASANQRKGRCGRLSDGVCIRLYAEDDFASRPEFTDPEILRTNLASVILQLTAARLGKIETFPFIDAPDRRNITDGVRLLEELGALEPKGRLTRLGQQLARLPVDPRLARMIIEAGENHCVREALVIVAGLAIQDPRERPSDQQQAADAAHQRFADKESDFLAYLNLWRYLEEQQQALSSNQFRKRCKAEFLHYLRIREWQDVHGQLRQVVRELRLPVNDEPADPTRIHTALLAGLLSHIGLRDETKREYAGARNTRFAIFPGSGLARKQPQWVMSAELVETSRLWARVNAKIEPGWIEPLAAHLLKRQYSEPHWEAKQGAVMGYEKVTLYGVPIVARRKINFARVDPELARELFIRHALVEGDWRTHHEFFDHNRALLEDVEELEHRARRRDILVDDETLYAFYDQRIPADVISARHFDSWWKQTRRDQPKLLHFERSLLVNETAAAVSEDDYPDTWEAAGVSLRLTYQFEPGADADGVTVHIPLALLERVPADGFDWQVPGLREQVITGLLRSLPKPLRRHFVPVPDHAADLMDMLPAHPDGALLPALERELQALTGIAVPREAWQPAQLPDHLTMTFRVLDSDDGILGEAKDLAALQARLKPKLRAATSAASASIERRGLKTWSFGTLARSIVQERAGYRVTAYPALTDEGDSVAIRVYETESAQRTAMRRGTRQLLLLNLPSPVTFTQGRLDNRQKLALARSPYRSVATLLDDCAGAAVDELVAEAGGPAWDEPGFQRLREAVRPELVDATLDVVTTVEQLLSAGYAVESHLGAAPADARADLRQQLSGLIYPGFVSDTGTEHLTDLIRYLKAAQVRLDKLPGNPQRDRQLTDEVAEVWQAYQELVVELGTDPDEVRRVRWMIEELRVNLYAQQLKTRYPVSSTRIYRAIDDLLP